MTDWLDPPIILNLVPTSFRLYVNADKDDHEEIVLLGEIKLKGRESVKLTTDEDFEKLEGILRLVDSGPEGPKDDKPIGWLTYCEKLETIDAYHAASYTLHVKIPS